MGRLYSYLPKALYKCSGNKPNFSRAFTLAEKISSDIYAFNKINIFNSFYPALFYLNGWEDKKQDYKKAYELFSKQDDSERSLMYLSYMNFKGLGIPKNAKKGLDFAIKLINERYVTDYKNSSTAIICEKKNV